MGVEFLEVPKCPWTGSQDSYLKAAKYSASPMGGSRPPVKAMLTLKPTPGPVPTCGKETCVRPSIDQPWWSHSRAVAVLLMSCH